MNETEDWGINMGQGVIDCAGPCLAGECWGEMLFCRIADQENGLAIGDLPICSAAADIYEAHGFIVSPLGLDYSNG